MGKLGLNPDTGLLDLTGGGGAGGIVTLDGDSGSATGDPVTIAGGTGITTSAAASTVTITSNIVDGIVTLDGDSGSATGDPVTIAGGTNITTSATGSTVTINANVPASGGWVFLSSATASASATLDFTASIDSTYNCYAFVLDRIQPASDNVDLAMRTSSDTGVSFDSTSGDYECSNTQVTNISPTTEITMMSAGCGNNVNEYTSGVIYCINPSNTSSFTAFIGNLSYSSNTGSLVFSVFGARREEEAVVDAIQFKFGSGNIAGGTISMYGVSKPS